MGDSHPSIFYGFSEFDKLEIGRWVTSMAIFDLKKRFFKTENELISLLFSKDWKIRHKAKSVLNRKYPNWTMNSELQKRVPELISALSGKDKYYGETAAEILGLIRASQAVKPLIHCLSDSIMGMAAVKSLGLIGDEQAIIPLIVTNNKNNKYFRKATMKALKKIDADWHRNEKVRNKIPELVDFLKFDNTYFEILDKIDPNWMKSKKVIRKTPEFVSALNDKDDEIRKAAAATLAKIADGDAEAALVDAFLNDTNKFVRQSLKDALDRINPYWTKNDISRNKIGELITSFESNDVILQRKSAEPLALIGNENEIHSLIRILSDKNEETSRKATRSIERINDSFWLKMKNAKPFLPDLIHALEYGSVHAYTASAKILGLIGDAGALDSLANKAHVELQKKARETGSADWNILPPIDRQSPIRKAIIQIIKTNQRISNDFDLFCSNCLHRRIERLKIDEMVRNCLEITPDFSLPICSSCQSSSNLLGGIKNIIGVIGGNILKMEFQEETIRLPVWNEKKKKALMAEIDALEIHNGNIGNYHYAIHSVIIKLNENAVESKEWLKKIPVYLKENPKLNDVEVNLLEDNFKFDKEGEGTKRERGQVNKSM